MELVLRFEEEASFGYIGTRLMDTTGNFIVTAGHGCYNLASIKSKKEIEMDIRSPRYVAHYGDKFFLLKDGAVYGVTVSDDDGVNVEDEIHVGRKHENAIAVYKDMIIAAKNKVALYYLDGNKEWDIVTSEDGRDLITDVVVNYPYAYLAITRYSDITRTTLGGDIVVVDMRSGEIVKRVSFDEEEGHTGEPAIAVCGDLLAVQSRIGLHVYDVRNPEEPVFLWKDEEVQAYSFAKPAFSPYCDVIAAIRMYDSEIRFYNRQGDLFFTREQLALRSIHWYGDLFLVGTNYSGLVDVGSIYVYKVHGIQTQPEPREEEAEQATKVIVDIRISINANAPSTTVKVETAKVESAED